MRVHNEQTHGVEFYKRLADALNARSRAFLSVPCDEFYEFAKELFTPEQAEIACSIPVSSATAEEVASKMKGANAQHFQHLVNAFAFVKKAAMSKLWSMKISLALPTLRVLRNPMTIISLHYVPRNILSAVETPK